MCKASIIIPAYNAGGYIGETLRSISEQTFSDFECIVIDDGSKDNTLEEVSKHPDNRVRVISQANSGGPAHPRNVGVSAAKGEYVFIFDADDVMEPNKLETYIGIFGSNKRVDFIFSDFSVIDEKGQVVKPRFLADYSSFRRSLKKMEESIFEFNMENFIEDIVSANFIGTSGVAFKKSLVDKTMLFDESVSSGDDKLAWVKLSKFSKFYFCDKVLHSYRVRPGSISNNNSEKLLKNKIMVLAKIGEISRGKQERDAIATKLGEYNYSLGYCYFLQKKYSLSRHHYMKANFRENFRKCATAILKTYVARLLDFLR